MEGDYHRNPSDSDQYLNGSGPGSAACRSAAPKKKSSILVMRNCPDEIFSTHGGNAPAAGPESLCIPRFKTVENLTFMWNERIISPRIMKK